ncbi:MFS transporter [Salinispirillum marinum]|uniref:MFS transporter n=2 Tax=Saccharospirillaceae TaxID=255527 RepID=A0ABV8BFG1_9GAMM
MTSTVSQHGVAFWLSPKILRLLTLALMLGLAGAAVFPVLSTHLATGLGISPFWIGIFFLLNTAAGIGVSHGLALASDRGLSRVRILWVAVTISALGALAMGYTTHYGLLLMIGMLWFGLSATAQPQLFALAREQISSAEAALFQSVLRASISFSWIIGPPLAYLLFERIGFTYLMWITSAMFGLALLLLPGLKDAPYQPPSAVKIPTNRRIKWLFLMMAAIFAANSMYIVYMPLYVRETLGIAGIAPGVLMGLAAGLEIPLMVGAGAMAHRWPLFRPLWVAVAGGLVFYAGIFLFSSFTLLMVWQIFNALLIGLAAGMGISVFQSLMQDRLGMASTLYSNAIKTGGLVGAAAGGLIAEWLGYEQVFLGSFFAMVIAFVALWQCAHKRHN